MGETKVSSTSKGTDRIQHLKLIHPAFPKFFKQAPQRLQNFFKVGGNFPQICNLGCDSSFGCNLLNWG